MVDNVIRFGRKVRSLQPGEVNWHDPEVNGHSGATLQVDTTTQLWIGGLGEPDMPWTMILETLGQSQIVGPCESQEAAWDLVRVLSAAIQRTARANK